MAIMDPARIPATREHLDDDERNRLLRFELLVNQGKHDLAQEVVEDLWIEAHDAHRLLFQGLSNAMTAVCAREARQLRGAREVAQRTHQMLAAFPRHVLDIDLSALLESMDDFVQRGEGPILLRREGASPAPPNP
jgi:hypothetical protein